MEDWGQKSRLTLLLDRFGAMKDTRQPWRVAYPLREVLLLAVCGTLADCDDYENIVAWGEAHLDFLRRFSPFHHGVPCADWLAALMNRIDGALFSACFSAWVEEAWPERPDLVAIDGKSVRRSHDHASGRRPLHLVSAFATKRRLVLGQEAVEDKSNEIAAIPALLERLDLKGALVSVDAMGCNPAVAEAITRAGADYLLAVKGNQPTLHAELAAYFDTAPAAELDAETTLDKSRGRIETRTCVVSRTAGWLNTDRAYPGAPRFPGLAAVARVEAVVEHRGKLTAERRYYITSRPLDAKACADAVQSHWAIENSLHWTLDVTFKEDASRIRTGAGPINMAVIRRFAFNLLRQIDDKKSLKTRRKLAGWSTHYLLTALQTPAR
jgi:predicted transposase YbfD/YdcC